MRRRKASNISAAKVCKLFQKWIAVESDTRRNFNIKYGDFLPTSLQDDIERPFVEILFSEGHTANNSNFELTRQVDITDQMVYDSMEDILRQVFKDLQANWKTLFSELSASE